MIFFYFHKIPNKVCLNECKINIFRFSNIEKCLNKFDYHINMYTISLFMD